jgi:hypothetical protein
MVNALAALFTISISAEQLNSSGTFARSKDLHASEARSNSVNAQTTEQSC